MFKIQTTSKKMLLKRRNFLSRTAAVGGMALFSASAAPVHALGTTANSLLSPVRARKTVRPGNATVNDFSSFVGQRFYLQAEGGTIIHAKLIEANSPKTRRGLRFRREQFSIIFDVPNDLELVQGQYRLSHAGMTSMELFMVPVDLPAKYNRLEAIFS